MRKLFRVLFFSFLLLSVSFNSFSKEDLYKKAENLFNSGEFQVAADILIAKVKESKAGSKVKVLYGRCLEGMTEKINTDAEMKCYRSPKAPKHFSCMKKYAENMNKKYGAGSFEYVHNIVTIRYSGMHYSGAKNGNITSEAAYYELTKNLIGKPALVLENIDKYIEKYGKGVWRKRALLLKARINEDIWWIHKNWSWLLYDGRISEEDLLIQGEAYRQEAIKLFKKVRGGAEGKMAKKELKLLKKSESDGKFYGIINESAVQEQK